MIRKVAGVLIIQDGYYVVQKRDNKLGIVEAGMLSIWGGAAENKETILTAAVRELSEETGVVALQDDLVLLKSYRAHRQGSEYKHKTVDVSIFLLELDPQVVVNCYEGEAVVRIKSLEEAITNGGKPTEFLLEAIRQYEATT